jgi:Transglutaminase-like superfamily
MPSHDFLYGDVLKSVMKIWRRFWRLSGAERGIALEAAAGLMATWAGLPLFGFRRWKNLLAELVPAGTLNLDAQGQAVIESARAITRLQGSASRNLPFRVNCLEQSLVLWWLLRRRGMNAQIRVGARKETNRFEAHAWVEFDGMVLNESGEGHVHFSPFEGSITSMETQTH